MAERNFAIRNDNWITTSERTYSDCDPLNHDDPQGYSNAQIGGWFIGAEQFRSRTGDSLFGCRSREIKLGEWTFTVNSCLRRWARFRDLPFLWCLNPQLWYSSTNDGRSESKWEIESSLMSQKFHLLHDSHRPAGIGQCNSDYGNFSFCFLARRRRIQIGKLFNEFSDSSLLLWMSSMLLLLCPENGWRENAKELTPRQQQ